ncbi:unnamed protein product [Effrenium voratum]|nr:unnamed protein product [Effrenium voratum]
MQVGENVADSRKIGIKEEGLDLHSFWLKVKQEVKEEAQSMDEDILKGGGFTKEEDAGVCKIETGTAVKVEHAESSHQVPTTATGSVKVEPQAGGSLTKLEKVEPGVVKGEPGSSAETGPQWARPGDGKPALPEFEEQVSLWARQCAKFRKRATWMPTRPCCPANVFFSIPVAPQEEDPPCVQRLSQKELSCLRRFFERGHPMFSAPLETGPTTNPSREQSGAAAATTQEEVGLPASGAACMKMWPWMRDLPSNIWAGRGWVYDEQSGARRLSSAGGADAMKAGSLLARPSSQLQLWSSRGLSTELRLAKVRV